MDMRLFVSFSDPAEVFPVLKTFISLFLGRSSCGGSIRADLQVLHSHTWSLTYVKSAGSDPTSWRWDTSKYIQVHTRAEKKSI